MKTSKTNPFPLFPFRAILRDARANLPLSTALPGQTGGALRIDQVRIVPFWTMPFAPRGKEARADDPMLLQVDMFDAGSFAVVPTHKAAMRQFSRWMLRLLFGPPRDEVSCASEPKTEVQLLQEKIRKWDRQAQEYEAMGLTELARRSRESIRGYRLTLKTLQDPTFRRAA